MNWILKIMTHLLFATLLMSMSSSQQNVDRGKRRRRTQNNNSTLSTCIDSNPQQCGCATNYQMDYRGTMNITKNGHNCDPWSNDMISMYPNSGLEDGSYCRNPDSGNTFDTDRAWCYVTLDDGQQIYELCDVPYCFPSIDTCNSQFNGSDNDELDNGDDCASCACDYTKCIHDSGDNISTYDQITDESKARCMCNYEIWDCTFGSNDCLFDPIRRDAVDRCKFFMEATFDDTVDGEMIASCESSIKPNCDDANVVDACDMVSQFCCEENDIGCRCEYEKKACLLALENNLLVADEYCSKAQVSCCGESNEFDAYGECACNLLEPICNDHPNNKQDYCLKAADACCGGGSNSKGGDNCKCDLLSFAVNVLGYKDRNDNAEVFCGRAYNYEPNHQVEEQALRDMYFKTGGNYWTNNEDWVTDIHHCNWYGIACGENDHVIEINLRNNNVTGIVPTESLSNLYRLERVDFGQNNLKGRMDDDADEAVFFNLRNLKHVDISHNSLSGEVDLLFAPALQNVNFSHNNITSVNTFKMFKRSHKTLLVADLSYNSIRRDASDLLTHLPPNIEELILSNNEISGRLYRGGLNLLAQLGVLHLQNNQITGSIPLFGSTVPNIRSIDFSNNFFEGTIPAILSTLPYLRHFNISGNRLRGALPASVSRVAPLTVLDVSSNRFTGTIPSELGVLGGISEVINLSHNLFEGRIPVELSHLEGLVLLDGNNDTTKPAPLSLCSVAGFDLGSKSEYCPPERNLLKQLYDSTKGQEWTYADNWMNEYDDHCLWHGIACKDNNVISIKLGNDGLSGRISDSIGDLAFLRWLDLSDNDVGGTLPSSIGKLTSLTHLRLSHNSLIGTIPYELRELKQLELVHLHTNRFEGVVPTLNHDWHNASSFITDCGLPTQFDDPLECLDCTMCCNIHADCHVTEPETIIFELTGYQSYLHFTWVFFLILVGLVSLIYIASLLHDRKKKRLGLRESTVRLEVDKDKHYALETIGADSVYSFFLTTSGIGWSIALAVTALQVCTLMIFVQAAQKKFDDDNSDFIYSWKCPRNSTECSDEANQNWIGWFFFAIIMAAYLMTDIISGLRLIVLSGKSRHRKLRRLRFFVGGFCLLFLSAFTVFATAVYNVAIARSNTEILINVVIILFISEIDEQFFRGIQAASPRWVENLRWKKNANTKDDDVQDRLHELDARLRSAEQHTVSANDNEEEEQSPQDSISSPSNNTRSAIEGLERRLESIERFNQSQEERMANIERILMANKLSAGEIPVDSSTQSTSDEFPLS